MSRNVDYDKDPIYIVQGDGWDMSFSVAQSGVAYDITGMQVDINVEDQVGNVIKAISSAGTSPEITIATSTYSIDATPFTIPGIFGYSVVLTNAGVEKTIAKSNIHVTKRTS